MGVEQNLVRCIHAIISAVKFCEYQKPRLILVTHSQESCTRNLCEFLVQKRASNFDANSCTRNLQMIKKQRQTTQTAKQQIVNSQRTNRPITRRLTSGFFCVNMYTLMSVHITHPVSPNLDSTYLISHLSWVYCSGCTDPERWWAGRRVFFLRAKLPF